MKIAVHSYFIKNQAKIFTALVLTGILSVSSGLTLIKDARAASANLSLETSSDVSKDNTKSNRLPRPVANAVLQDLASREGISTRELKITNYNQQTWSNGCLELPQPDEACTEALVSGWRVVVSNGRENWIYHTDSNGRSLRLASANTPSDKLPTSIKNAVLQAASKRLQQPISQLRIVESQQQTWRNGCLELANPDEFCTQALVPGWRVVVSGRQQTLVYHTNQTGSVVRLNQKPNQSTLTPVTIPVSELPPPLDRDVVFRQISSGGFAGTTYETVLLRNGQLIRVRIGDANDSERSVRRVSVQQVRQFLRSLERYKFTQFRNLSYPAPGGAADYITYTLTSQKNTVQYNDISQNNLPSNLQVVIKAWNQITASAQ
ncbi:hypothetical protein VF14_35845 [Nostoc linckia z18]|uniref:Uncharacterized protein n=2 Tax=Nostoc linckia TaxID=92942 RepID=A0A9Q6EHP7_NOSLI|nr:hypothetical protein [Nostoc linckia]PHK24285.1 hypothetical protein VF12_37695 [Nostoc linckia z15]PHK39327.1 hypothetical protein VF13_34635 [Nostoc linckia z16]PHJ57850.1 hypothetical protein VF02_29110 [Nostoc linckia z1]PHJ60500.1 hypothetical protein VF05_30320 [Nostoc linckia z3]PHJ62099.1 hypothetical protein VF03_31505 [Nostoc linckia z2]